MTEAFKDAVIEYLRPYEGNFNYGNMLRGHIDISRFHLWVGEVPKYRAISGSTVLSSGCGSAGDLQVFLEMGASKAHGIEVSEGLADLARLRFQGTQFERRVEIVTYDGSILPYVDGCFDIVFSMHVVEHTQNPELYLTELFRVLKPGGVVFLDLPSRYYWREQHTLLPFIHFPPTKERDVIINSLLAKPLRYLWSEQTLYKLQTLRGFQFPSASELVRIYNSHKDAYLLELRDALFFASMPNRVPYRALSWKHWLGLVRNMTTFRMVIGKLNG